MIHPAMAGGPDKEEMFWLKMLTLPVFNTGRF